MGQRELDLPAMRKFATGTLVVLVAIYLATFVPTDPGWPVKLLRAAAGAGIVGGLADWFAVVALFRHPLGLPIPHTALLPRNQSRVAVNVGRFIEENFLQTDLILEKLKDSAISAKLAAWLLREGQSGYFVERLLQGVVQVLRADMPDKLMRMLSKLVRKLTGEAAGNPKVAQELSKLLQRGLKGETLTEIVEFLHETVDQNRGAVERLVRDNSRWWIASRLDRNASELIVNGLLSVLEDLAKPDSKLRKDFEDAAVQVLGDFTKTDHLQHVIENAAADYSGTVSFEHNLRALITSMKGKMADYLESDEAVSAIQTYIRQMAERLAHDEALQQKLDSSIADFAARMIPEARPYIGEFVAQTISGWDPDLLVERFETEAGKDLQFIRINGALLGFAIGGILFTVEHLIG
jgi:uncharacterized membrane-anchored protein YjiN (DUF445 family)